MKRTPLKRYNSARRKKNWERRYGEKSLWLHGFPCDNCNRHGEIHAHHIVGKNIGGAKEHLIPLCPTCHREWHDHGRDSFCNAYQYNATERAAHYEEEWRKRNG
jgi:hypothetical protein